MRPSRVILPLLPLWLAGCLPPATTQTAAPVAVAKLKLPTVTLAPPAIIVDGKPVVSVCPVRVTVVATRYSSGSVFYEVTDLVPEKADGFEILSPRVETTIEKNDAPPANANTTHLHVAHRRSATNNDLIQVHVTVEVERADDAGRKHAPTLVVTCKTELWGWKDQVIGEQKLIDDGEPRWSPVVERVESHTRVDVESDLSPAVQIPADAQWIPQDKEESKEEAPRAPRRPVGHNSFVVKRGV